MFARLHAQLHEIRLGLQQWRLGHQERLALRRRGREVARAGAAGSEVLAPLVGEIAERERRAQALTAEVRASLDTDRADLHAVAVWVSTGCSDHASRRWENWPTSIGMSPRCEHGSRAAPLGDPSGRGDAGARTLGPDPAPLAPAADRSRDRRPGRRMVDREHLHRFTPPLGHAASGAAEPAWSARLPMRR
jgi:hypothetical protein